MNNSFPQTLIDSFEYQCVRSLRFLVLWSAAYFLVHFGFSTSLKKEAELDLKNRLVSIIHGIACFLLSSYFIFFTGSGFESLTTYLSSGIICLSFGYFMYDLVACLCFGLYDSKLIIHHGLCLSGMTALLYFNRGMFACVLGLFLAESSNFPMHLRCILRTFGLKNTLLCELCETAYMLIYIFFRGILGPVFCVMAFLSPATPLVIAFTFMLLILQSFSFIFTMISILKKKMANAAERKQMQVNLFWFEVNPKILQLEYAQKKKTQENLF